jgi:site-specific DNA recombinase
VTVPRRIAIYARVSSEDQAERGTIQTQLDELDRRLAHEPDVVCVERYIDDGVSGTISLGRRPEGGRLLRDAAAGRFDEVWVYKFDRLGRHAPDLLAVGRQFLEIRVKLVSLFEGTPDLLMWDILSAISDNDRRTLLRKTGDGLDRTARAGRYGGGISPFGYVVLGERSTAALVPDERPLFAGQTAAQLVRWMYERIALDHWTCPKLARELNARGVPTPYVRDGRGVRGKATAGVWRSGRLRNLLVNPTYRGEQQYGRRTKNPHREVISALIPELVSRALWDAAQAVLAANRLIPKHGRRRYLLRSVVHCAGCGLSYTGTPGRDGTAWYRCGGRTRERGPLDGHCTGRAVKAADLEDIIWSDLDQFLRNPGAILAELDPAREREAASAVTEAESITLSRALSSVVEQRERVLALHIRGRISAAEADHELDRIEDQRVELERRIANLVPDAAAPVIEPDLLDALRARLDTGLTDDQRQEIVQLLVHVVIHTEPSENGKPRGRAVVTYRFPAVLETRTPTGSSPPRVRRSEQAKGDGAMAPEGRSTTLSGRFTGPVPGPTQDVPAVPVPSGQHQLLSVAT